MATATLPPDAAIGWVDAARNMGDAFDSVKFEDLTPDRVLFAISACRSLRAGFAMARQSIEASLIAGIDAKAFAANHDRLLPGLDALLATVARVLAKAQTSHFPTEAEQFLSDFRALEADVIALRQFLLEALTKAKSPSRPIDWNRVHESEAAYARGGTKRFQRSSTRPAQD
jgi:hypothetical protein